jgi:hypothetical protein
VAVQTFGFRDELFRISYTFGRLVMTLECLVMWSLNEISELRRGGVMSLAGLAFEIRRRVVAFMISLLGFTIVARDGILLVLVTICRGGGKLSRDWIVGVLGLLSGFLSLNCSSRKYFIL